MIQQLLFFPFIFGICAAWDFNDGVHECLYSESAFLCVDAHILKFQFAYWTVIFCRNYFERFKYGYQIYCALINDK